MKHECSKKYCCNSHRILLNKWAKKKEKANFIFPSNVKKLIKVCVNNFTANRDVFA